MMKNIKINKILLNIVENLIGIKPLHLDAPNFHLQGTAYATGN